MLNTVVPVCNYVF